MNCKYTVVGDMIKSHKIKHLPCNCKNYTSPLPKKFDRLLKNIKKQQWAQNKLLPKIRFCMKTTCGPLCIPHHRSFCVMKISYHF